MTTSRALGDGSGRADAGRADADRAASDRLVHDRDAGIERLLEIMRRLRAPDGCPWDRAQTFRTIAPFTIEEACEVADAIERGGTDELADELGDLLLQVVYHAQIADEAGQFGFADVVRAIADKMVRRHPHVFGAEPGAPLTNPADVDWEAIKAAERAARGEVRASVLDGVPATLSGLTRAVALTRRAARVGFDWTDPADVLAKLTEEAAELTAEIDRADHQRMEEEYGDLLFVMANLARQLRLDPEAALRRANAKFDRRFRAIEQALRAQGRGPEQATLAEMDALWNQAKVAEKG
jgi:ATP diphosphatase